MAKKIAEQLIDTLVKSGVERIYAVTGDSLNEVNEAVRKNDQIKWIHVRHEETGAYAAAAEAQLTGRPGCCAGSSGPGHVHLINGLYDAHRSGAPVIAIASTIPTGEFGTEYFQETNTIKLFNDCSYYNEVATTPTQFPRMLQSAIQTAVTRKGVSVIGLPGDLAKASAVTVDSSVINYPAPPEVCPSEEDLAQLADLLNKHTRITLFCGIGCRGAHEEVIALSEKLNAPVVYTFKGKMEVQYENPYEVGMTGLLGMPSGYYSMHEAEVLLMLGTDFPYSAFLPDDIKIAQIDIKPERLGRRAKVDIGLCGDVKLSIQSLLRMLNPKTDDSFLLKQLKRYEGVKKDLAAYTEDKGDVNKIHPEYVMSEIDKLSSDDAVFTVDTGMTCVWGARYLQATGKRHMLGSFNHGSMANALPQAIGAALAYPQTPFPQTSLLQAPLPHASLPECVSSRCPIPKRSAHIPALFSDSPAACHALSLAAFQLKYILALTFFLFPENFIQRFVQLPAYRNAQPDCWIIISLLDGIDRLSRHSHLLGERLLGQILCRARRF